MKLLFLATFIATVCYANAGKTQRMLAALNAGMLAGMNGGLANGVIPGMMAGGLNPPMVVGGLNPSMLVGGLNPQMVVGGLNPPIVAAGGAGFIRQPQFAQFVPGLPAYALPANVPNVYPVPAANALPFMGVPQMPQMNLPQQPLMGGAMQQQQQQPPAQPDPLRRFRRQIMKQDNTPKTTVDTQIPPPEATPCEEEGRHTDY